MAQRVVYDDGSFDLVEASALDMQAAMNAGVVTSVELVQAYLDRIAAYDATVVDTAPGGRALNSIIATSDVALDAAAASDAYRAEHGAPRSMLDGIPILLKDNYDTADLPTTAGCGCWEDNQTEDDATMVAGLREGGAVVLGKASLDEFAYGFASEFSAGSPVGGSKLVASPYVTSRTAGGSSGGTGAAIAANLGAIGFGTDTGGSIRVPSSYNQLVGVRPTVGLASRDGIVPLALSQDTGGPMARTVADAAIALDAVVGTDGADAATAEADSHVPDSYTSYLAPDALEGKHFAYLESMVSSNATVRRLWEQAVADLRAAGATVEPISIDGIAPVLGESSGSTNEFKHDLDEYIANHLDADAANRSLDDILASGHFVTSRRNTYVSRNNVTPETYESWMESHTAVLDGGGELVTSTLDDLDLDALLYPSGTPYGTHSTNLRLSPNTGLPSVTVPMGQATAEDGTITGAGVNLEMLGRDWSEGELLGMAYAYEQATAHRTTPELYGPLAGDTFPGTGADEDAEAGDGTVVIDAPRKVTAGERFTVTVEQAAVDNAGYALTLGYDADAVRLVDTGTEDSGYTTVDRGEGRVTLTHSELGTSPTTAGATTLASYTFLARSTGRTGFEVSDLQVVDSAGVATSAEAVPVATQVAKARSTTKVSVTPDSVKVGAKVRIRVAVSTAAGLSPRGTVRVAVAGRTVRAAAPLRGGALVVRARVTRPGVTTVKAVYSPSNAVTSSRDTAKVRAKRR
ncbi:amidase family protein [Nocardioides sambongensis]|uniref:amidase family protein n=1 Tax=Nocardioides sambongensis TaxID=2589074 RepID=UPI0018C8B105|nr:amidase family protein [Nocardioides sambongensis]